MKLEDYIKNVPNFPKEGIQFKDITPLIGDGEALRHTIHTMADFAREKQADIIVGPDARGFIFGTPVAYELGIGFIPVRKPGKLPRETISMSYELEYGENTLAMHKEDIQPGQKVVIVDDLLATGGTVEATIKMIEAVGAEVVGCIFLIELDFLAGRDKLNNIPILTLLHY